MSEKKIDILIPWQPLNKVPPPFVVESIRDDQNGLQILMRDTDDNLKVSIVFESALAYRNTNESYLLSLWSSVAKESLGKIFYFVHNSSYLSTFHLMSEQVYEEWNIKHFAIYTIEDCIDVLSVAEPTIIELRTEKSY